MLLLAAGIWAEVLLVSTWMEYKERLVRDNEDVSHVTNFMSEWTFFWPGTLGILLVVAGAASMLKNSASNNKLRMIYELA